MVQLALRPRIPAPREATRAEARQRAEAKKLTGARDRRASLFVVSRPLSAECRLGSRYGN